MKKWRWWLLGTGMVVWVALGMPLPAWLQPAAIRELGVIGPVIYVLLVGVLGGIGMPPLILMLPAAAVWEPLWLLPMNMAGGFLACQTGFWLSRHFFRDQLSPKIPAKLKRYEHRLEQHGLTTVLVMRQIFYLLPPINWMLGISDLSQRTFQIGTLIGMIPWTLFYTLTGHGAMTVIQGAETWQILVGMAVIATGIGAWGMWAFRKEDV